jgi:hypothetical protein
MGVGAGSVGWRGTGVRRHFKKNPGIRAVYDLCLIEDERRSIDGKSKITQHYREKTTDNDTQQF